MGTWKINFKFHRNWENIDKISYDEISYLKFIFLGFHEKSSLVLLK